MPLRFAAVLSVASMISGPAPSVRDLLPLKHGIFVERDVPCALASHATGLSYRGDRNGINDQRTERTITSYRRYGRRYVVRRRCSDVRSEYRFSERVTVVIKDASSFTLINPRFSTKGTSYRHCRAKM